MNYLDFYQDSSWPKQATIEFKNVKVKYRKGLPTVLNDLSFTIESRVSVQGVESLWGDCRFILADWGSQ